MTLSLLKHVCVRVCKLMYVDVSVLICVPVCLVPLVGLNR